MWHGTWLAVVVRFGHVLARRVVSGIESCLQSVALIGKLRPEKLLVHNEPPMKIEAFRTHGAGRETEPAERMDSAGITA